MKVAGSRFTKSSRGVGAGVRSAARRSALLGVLIGSVLGIGAASASAAFLHPTLNYSFGSAGTSGSTFAKVRELAFHQSEKRLYVLAAEAPTAIHAFTYAGPSILNPVGGSWPLEVENVRGEPGLAVDNTIGPSAGHILYSFNCGCPTSNVFAYDRNGNGPLFVFTVDKVPAKGGGLETATGAGVAIDSQGNIWVANESPGKVEQFAPTGGAPIRVIETPQIGASPDRIAIDPTNDDLYIGVNQGVVRLTKASNYDLSSATNFGVPFPGMVGVDGSIDRLYVAPSNGKIKVFSTVTGTLIEEFGSGQNRGIAIDEATHNVFIASNTESKVQEWRAVSVPDMTTGPPVGNKKVSGTVGLGSSGLEVTECYFEFGTSTGYGTTEKCQPEAPYTADLTTVTAELPGLEEEETYHYRLVARNTNGLLSQGEDETITPGHVGFLKTKPASNIQRLTATLNGSFEGTGEDTRYYFEWGPTPALGEETPEEDRGVTTGPTDVSADISGLNPETPYYYRVVAENSKGKTIATDILSFTTAPSIKDLLSEAATNIDTTTATLNGSLDPDGYTTEFYFEYGRTTAYGHTSPAPPGEPVGNEAPGLAQVSTDIQELEPGLLYHFRVVATNSFGTTHGPDETFSTEQVPSITSFSSKNISATSADLTASINPNGPETTYYFEYGPSEDYGARAPVPSGVIPPGNAPQDVVVHISGLSELTYHFRLTAENKWGSTTTENQTFDFALPTGCPNHSVRQQTRAGYLPDCRAYELVSPGRAGGAFLFPEGPTSAYASSNGRLAFSGLFTAIPGAGEPMVGSLSGDLYISSRANDGWSTRYVGIPGSHSLKQSGPPDQFYEGEGTSSMFSDLEMNRFLVWDYGQMGFANGGILEGSFAPFMYDNRGNFIRRLPTNLDEIPGADADITEGGFTGYARPSADFSHYVFSSFGLAFAPGGLTGAPTSVYDNDLESETVTIASKLPNGEDIPSDPNAGPLQFQDDYMSAPAVSADGSHILMAVRATGGSIVDVREGPHHLYMAVDGALHYEVSLGDDMENHGVNLVGMSKDGSKVYFTTSDQLTVDDTDSSIDLYLWSENGGSPEVSRVSTGSGETSNSDSCDVTWVSDCDIEIPPIDSSSYALGGYGRPTDNVIAGDTGEIYFYSPEELDTTHGEFGSRNLYVYREGRPQHVATLEPNKPIRRIQVVPDGDHVAIITNSRLTAYDNNSAMQMYLLEPATRKTICVSCRPDGAVPESNVEGSLNGRFITDDGRAFFTTGDALIPRDADGVKDVYEFVAGRPQLITTGTAEASFTQNQTIGLIGVSADGVDAFFSTNDTLVRTDENGPYLKFYNARTNGGFLLPDPLTPCVAADECHGKEAPAAAPLSVGTGARLGDGGNVQPAGGKKCGRKSKSRKSKKKCRQAKKKRGKRRKRSGQGHQRETRRHRGGGRND